MNRYLLISLLAVSLSLGACGKSESTPGTSGQTSGAATSTPTSPAAAKPVWVLAAEPSDAAAVADAKASSEEGDEVVIRARIGGRMEPISDDSPIFTVMDLSVPHCGQMAEDHCPTPWDYCCEPTDSIKANAATVQLVDAQSKPIATSPTTQGFAALDEVVIVGTVGPRPSPDVFTIKATGVYRVGQ